MLFRSLKSPANGELERLFKGYVRQLIRCLWGVADDPVDMNSFKPYTRLGKVLISYLEIDETSLGILSDDVHRLAKEFEASYSLVSVKYLELRAACLVPRTVA